MAIYDLYSKRQKKLNGDTPDVYVYDNIPPALRAQIHHILNDVIGNPTYVSSVDKVEQAYESISNVLVREYGFLSLPDAGSQHSNSYRVKVLNFLLNSSTYDQVLDVVEISFRLIDYLRSETSYENDMHFGCDYNGAVKELNYRCRENGIGYQLESGEIIRVDSQLVHAEVTKPALVLLSDATYSGANEEFLKAHEHYRHANYKECLNECLKSFESTMKSICDKRGWAYDPRATAQKLIEVCFANDLVPQFLQSQFSSLKSGLESGMPTVRNRLGGHGQGSQQVVVPEYLASYLLHLTATTILMLIKAEKELP